MKLTTTQLNWLLAYLRAEFLLVFGLLLLPISIQAQEDDEDEGENIFEISPFVVEEGSETGYIATQTLAGTRLRSSLQDIGASVQVITTEFLDDIGATESNDLLLFTTSTETAGLGGNFSGGEARQDDRVIVGGVLSNPQGANRVRGLGAPDNTRDFFLTDIPFDSYNTGRIEINRGANAILFGLGSPSGVLNAGLNRAVFDEINQVEFRIQDGGENPSYRATMDFNRVLIEDKLALRVNLLSYDREYSQKPTYQRQNRAYVTATWNPLENTTIRASYENGIIRANSPDPVGPLQAIDEYIREIGRYHAALAADGNYTGAPETNLPLTYDPWRWGMRYPNSVFRRVDNQVNNYNDPTSNQGLGQSLAAVWGSNTAEPDFGFPGVIRNGANDRPDFLPGDEYPGFQHKVYYDFQRPADGSNGDPGTPRGPRSFRRIDNAGARASSDFTGVYEGFNDLDLFDFSENLLAGSAPFQNRDFDALHASLEQTYLDNKLGYEIAFTKQTFERENFNGFPGRTMGVLIDINETLPIGSFDHNNDPFTPVEPQANPNFGRPFMVGKASKGEFRSERESLRWTGFWEFNTADWMGDNIWSQILGRHILTGLASTQDVQRNSLNFSQREFGPREAALNENFGTRPDPRHFDYLVYLGDAVDLKSNPAGITRDMFQINPVDQQKVWNPGGPPIMTTYFDYDKQEMVTYPLERRAVPINGELNGTENDSLAVILQSFLIDENIVGTMGWRQDEVTNNLANTPILTDTATAEQISSLGIVNDTYDYYGTIAQNAAGEYLFEEPQITFVKEDIFAWGVVAKLPNDWHDIGWLNHASLFYNTSENFQPAPGREDHLGQQIPSPTGETEDIGINLTLLDNKINVRINRFEAAINNANNAGVNRVYAQAAPGMIRGFINNMLNDLATDDFDEVEEDEEDPEFGELTHIPFEEALDLFNEYTQYLGATIDRENNTITLDESNPYHNMWIENNWRLIFNEGLGVSDGLDQNQAGQTDTLDQVSKGYELEVVANPFSGFRLLFNVAQVETSNSNIAPTMRAFIEEEFGPWAAGTLTNPSKFGALHRGTPFYKPSQYGGNPPNTNANHWTNNILRDWEVIKAQEGTFTPEVRKYRLNFVANYDFQEGALRGFGFGVTSRYQSRVAIGFPIAPDAEGVPKPDIANPFYGPSDIQWGLRLAYRKRIFDGKVNWRLQLNLSNIFSDERDLIPVRMNDVGVIAQSRTSAPKGWMLSSRFDW